MKRHNWMQSITLDKESDRGRWLLTYSPDDVIAFRLRVTVGGPHDWFCFVAEVQWVGEMPTPLARFDVAPVEIIPHASPRGDATERPWDPQEEPEFLEIPATYRDVFVELVRHWGRLAGLLVPGPAWLTIH
jgi:hypothetical protein